MIAVVIAAVYGQVKPHGAVAAILGLTDKSGGRGAIGIDRAVPGVVVASSYTLYAEA